MKILLLYTIVFLLGISCACAQTVFAADNDFSLMATVPLRVSVGGPIPVSLQVTYNGARSIKLRAANNIFLRPSFITPDKWKQRDSALIFTGDFVSELTLTKGKTISRVVYLHDYFSVIAPGEIEIPITLELWSPTNRLKPIATLNHAVKFTVFKEAVEEEKTRIQKTFSRIQKEKDVEKRWSLYHSLLHLSHKDLIPVLVHCLIDTELSGFSVIVQSRLYEMCKQTKDWRPIIQYLARYETRGGEQFFALWESDKIDLSTREVMQLCDSESVYTQMLCLKHFGKNGIPPAEYKSMTTRLKAFAKELNDAVSAADDKGKQASRRGNK